MNAVNRPSSATPASYRFSEYAILREHLRLVRDEEWLRLKDVTDAEYFWEPAPRMWSVAPVGMTRTATVGRKEWVLEFPRDDNQPDVPPATTIAWRMTHMYLQNLMYHQVIFTDKRLRFDDFPIANTGLQATELWLSSIDAYIDGFNTLSASDLGIEIAMPWDETLTISKWTMSFLFHNTHHSAEVGVLRDLFRELGDARPGQIGRTLIEIH